jgi:hypothetical protein
MDEMVKSPAGPKRRPRRWWRRILFGLAALVLGSIGLLLFVRAYFLHSAEKRLEAAIAEADRLDPGWRWDDLLARRETIPDDKNSAPHVLAAAKLLPKNWSSKPVGPPGDKPGKGKLPAVNPAPNIQDDIIGRLGKLDSVQELDEELAADARTRLNEVGPALARARPIINLPKGRHTVAWASDYVSTRVDHTTAARNVGWLFGVAAALQAHDGQFTAALGSIRGILNTGRSIGDEPILVSQLVRVALDNYAVVGLERVLAQGEAPQEELKKTQALFEAETEAARPLTVFAIQGERAAMYDAFGRVCTGEVSVDQLTESQPPPPGLTRDLLLWLWIGPLARYNRAVFLELMTRAVEIAKKPPSEQAEPFERLVNELQDVTDYSPHRRLAVIMVPGVHRVVEAHNRVQAHLRCAQVATAVERYRLKHGQWPDSLEQLVPNFIAKVPDDPYVPGPLRFRKLNDGVVIYSVGADGEDNHGTLDRKHPRPGTDIGFRLWDLDKRRQPPRE